MKKLFLLCLTAVLTLSVAAQNPAGDIDGKYKGKQGYFSVTLDAAMINMTMAMQQDMDADAKKMMEQTTEMTSMVLNDASLSGEFVKECMAAFDKGGYDFIRNIDSAENGVTGKVYAKTSGDKVTEIVVVFGTDSVSGAQVFKGNYDKSMLDAAAAGAMGGK